MSKDSNLLPKQYLGMQLSSWGMWFWDQPWCSFPFMGHQPEKGMTQALLLPSQKPESGE